MNTLFLDFIDKRQQLSHFFPNSDAVPDYEIPHRNRLCEILRNQNEAFGNSATSVLLERLAKPGTRCVITGQQVGLLTGPMYTIWKALTVIRVSELMAKRGTTCVPVFWMASEDHNLHEVMNFSLLRNDLELLTFSLKEHLFLSREPVGKIPTSRDEIRKVLLRVQAEIKLPELKEIYSNRTLSEAFARTLLWLLKELPILIVDPSDPELKKLAQPFFKKLLKRKDVLMQTLRKQNDMLQSRGYPVQVKMEENALPLFEISNNERKALLRTTEARFEPEHLSPSALSRPLMQDYLFPTLAYIGGPGEITYFAQLHPWYDAMDLQQPWLLPRASLTLLPPSTRSFLELHHIEPQELYMSEDSLVDALLSSSELEAIRSELKIFNQSVKYHFERMRSEAEKIDKTLKNALDTAERKIQYQLQKSERKAFFAVKRKNYSLGEQVRKARNVVYPAEKLQERYLNIFSFSARLPELISEIYHKFDPELAAHQWIDI